MTEIFESSSDSFVPPLLLAVLMRLLLRGGGRPSILCGRCLWAASGELAYMLCGRILPMASGVPGGDTIAMDWRGEGGDGRARAGSGQTAVIILVSSEKIRLSLRGTSKRQGGSRDLGEVAQARFRQEILRRFQGTETRY